MLKQHNRVVRRAFTLIELIIVVLIIAIVIAISLPALGSAKTAAKKASSQTLAINLGTAIAAFQNDENRMPGYFSAAEMGAASNVTQGFTTLENAMLDLMGGVVAPSVSGSSVIDVGPDSSETVKVDLELIGTIASYFTIPDKRAYIAQDGVVGGLQAGTDDHRKLPDLVDAFGTPVLLWIENPGTRGTIVQAPNSRNDPGIPFALVDSGSNSSDGARYYWASNAGFLNSDRLGELGRSQTRQGSDPRFSLIGGSVDKDSLNVSLMGLLGSPSNANIGLVDPDETLPGASRGGFTVQMAGPDGMYVSSTDKGAARFAGAEIEYWRTWFVSSSTRVTNDEGKPSSKDVIIDSFDDFLLSGAH